MTKLAPVDAIRWNRRRGRWELVYATPFGERTELLSEELGRHQRGHARAEAAKVLDVYATIFKQHTPK